MPGTGSLHYCRSPLGGPDGRKEIVLNINLLWTTCGTVQPRVAQTWKEAWVKETDLPWSALWK